MASEIGFLKLHRCLMKKPIWLNSTPEQKTVLITILMMVNFSETSWEWKGEKFTTQPGQTITSIDSIIKYAGKGITIQNVRSSLLRFEKLGFLTNESTKTGRLITIVNWRVYQPLDEETNIDSNREPTDDQQRANKEPTPKGEGNNDKEEKEGDNITPTAALNLFKELCPSLPVIRKMSSDRMKSFNARLKELKGNFEEFKEVLITVEKSDFLTGRIKSDRPFKADVDWILNPNNFLKILEGKYNNKQIVQGGRKITIER